MAAIVVALMAVLSLILRLFDFVEEKLFPSGIRAAHKPRTKPLLRRISLPLCIALGVFLATLGLNESFIGWFY